MTFSIVRFARPLFAVCLAFASAGCGALGCPSGTGTWNGNACEPPSAVHLNTVGFLPERAKQAVVLQPAGGFALVTSDGTPVWSGVASGPVRDGDTGQE